MSLCELFYVKNQPDINDFIKEVDFDNERMFSYRMCPVWKHKSQRTFVVTSPCDFSFFVDVEKNNIVYHDDTFTKGVENCFITLDDVQIPHPIIQCSFPSYFFWSNIENVWMEFKSHPMTSINNNFVAVEGWFNISNTPKDTPIGMKVLDHNSPIKIKKGDPLYRLSFYPDNFNDHIVLTEQSDVPKEIDNLFQLNQQRKMEKSFSTSVLFSRK